MGGIGQGGSIFNFGAKTPQDAIAAQQKATSPDAYGQKFANAGQQITALLNNAPTQQPDLTDPVVQAQRSSALLSQQMKRGRASTFLTSDQAALAPPTVGTKTLLGG